MPQIWAKTIEQHRHEVRDAILDTTARLAHEQGLRAVTMSQIAKDTGIGRATLYNYFASVEEIVVAWHARQVDGHLAMLAGMVSEGADPGERLRIVLHAHAMTLYEQHTAEAGLLHPQLSEAANAAVQDAGNRLLQLLTELLADAAHHQRMRRDCPADELAQFVVHSLGAAAELSSPDAVARLVMIVVDALAPRDA